MSRSHVKPVLSGKEKFIVTSSPISLFGDVGVDIGFLCPALGVLTNFIANVAVDTELKIDVEVEGVTNSFTIPVIDNKIDKPNFKLDVERGDSIKIEGLAGKVTFSFIYEVEGTIGRRPISV